MLKKVVELVPWCFEPRKAFLRQVPPDLQDINIYRLRIATLGIRDRNTIQIFEISCIHAYNTHMA
jgi:hypothetical protein